MSKFWDLFVYWLDCFCCYWKCYLTVHLKLQDCTENWEKKVYINSSKRPVEFWKERFSSLPLLCLAVANVLAKDLNFLLNLLHLQHNPVFVWFFLSSLLFRWLLRSFPSFYVRVKTGLASKKKIYTSPCYIVPLQEVHLEAVPVAEKNHEVNLTAIVLPTEANLTVFYWWIGKSLQVKGKHQSLADINIYSFMVLVPRST